MRNALALPVALVLACGDADGSGADGGTDPIPEPGTPILDRESLATHQCGVLDQPAEVAGNTQGSTVAPVGDAALVARTSYGPVEGDEFRFILGVTPVTFSPMGLGNEAYLITAPGPLRLPALTAAGDGAALAWVAGDPWQDIRLARLDGSGNIIGSAATIAQPDATVVAVSLAVTGSTTHVLWADSSTLKVQRLGEGVDPLADPVAVRSAPMSGAVLAPAGDVAVAVWSELEEDAGVYLALLDASGAVTAGPLRVSAGLPEFTYVDSPAVIATGDEILVAWSEHFWQEDPDGDPGTWDPRGHAVIRVARVAGDGGRVLAFESLQAVEENIIHIQPAFSAIDGGLALSWSRGTFISVCGGCVSDNTRHLVPLDPGELVPLGDVVEMVGVTGFSSATMIATGGDLLHLLGLDYHAISNVALARTTCAAR